MKPEEFKVGVKFKYVGGEFPEEKDIIQTILAIDGIDVITNMQSDFDLESSYAIGCVLVSEPEKLYTASEVEKIREASFEAAIAVNSCRCHCKSFSVTSP